MASLSPPASNRSRQYIPKYFKSPFEDEQENIDSARTSIIDAQSISTIADDTHLTHIDANLRLPKIAVGISAAPHEMSAGEIRQPKVDTPLESSLTYRATTKSRGGEYKKSATKIQAWWRGTSYRRKNQTKIAMQLQTMRINDWLCGQHDMIARLQADRISQQDQISNLQHQVDRLQAYLERLAPDESSARLTAKLSSQSQTITYQRTLDTVLLRWTLAGKSFSVLIDDEHLATLNEPSAFIMDIDPNEEYRIRVISDNGNDVICVLPTIFNDATIDGFVSSVVDYYTLRQAEDDYDFVYMSEI